MVQCSLAAVLVDPGLTGIKNGSRQICEEVRMVTYTTLVASETGLWRSEEHTSELQSQR